jgi:Cu-processing system ATP-binding protein
MTAAGLSMRGLRKHFGKREVLRGIDLEVLPGRITAIVGPNAAGKTTLIKAILGLVRPDRQSGPVQVDGMPVNGDPGYRERIGYMPQAAQFPEELTGREVLGFLKSLRGRAGELDEELIGRFALGDALDQPVRTLSGGSRQKLNAIAAFLFRPAVLILDEPTASLDPVAAGVLKDKVRQASSGGATVVITSHILSEVEELAEDIVFLVEGEIRFAGPLEALRDQTGEAKLERAIAKLLTEGAR